MKYRIKADGNGRFYAQVKWFIFWRKIENYDTGIWVLDSFPSQASAKEAIIKHKKNIEWKKNNSKRETIDEGDI